MIRKIVNYLRSIFNQPEPPKPKSESYSNRLKRKLKYKKIYDTANNKNTNK